MRNSLVHPARAGATLGAMMLVGLAHAQQQPPANDLNFLEGEQTVTDSGREFRFIFGGGYTHTFDTDLDSGGDFSVDRLTGGLNVATDINRDMTIDFRLNFGMASYDFGGPTGFGTGFGGLDPWSDIGTVGFGAAIAWRIDDKWTVFGGPLFQFSGESGADWGDSFNGGGIFGATYRVNDRLILGGGVSVMSQIEDDVRVFPLIIVQWRISDEWRISNAGPSGGRSSIELTGLELIWTPTKKWEFALGAGSAYSRFRLDDDDVAPDGVGEDESTPIWLRVDWKPHSTFNLEAIAGVAVGGELKLDDSGGNGIAESDYDPALFVGIFGSVRF